MYILKTKFVMILLLGVFCSCASNKEVSVNQDIIGKYKDNKHSLILDLKEDGSFLLKDNLKREFCLGTWRLDEPVVKLNCEKPKHVTDYISSYKILTDSVIELRIKRGGGLYFNKKLLSKMTD